MGGAIRSARTWKGIWFVVVFAFLACSSLASIGEDREGRVRQAEKAWAAGNFEEARASLAQAVEMGPAGPGLYYNLGNAALRAGRVGESILAYRRALWLDPGYSAARINLELARSRMEDRQAPVGWSLADQVWNRLQAWVGPNRTACVFLGGLLVLVCFLPLRIRGKRRIPAALLWTVGGMCLLSGGLLGVSILVDLSSRDCVVLSPTVEVRGEPDRERQVLFRVSEGTEAQVIQESGSWMKILLPNGWSGWVQTSCVGNVAVSDH